MIKYLVFFIIFILVIFTLLLLAYNVLPISVVNREKSTICLSNVKVGAISYLRDKQLNSRKLTTFFDIINFSDQFSVSYYRGQCGNDSSPTINLSCSLELRTEFLRKEGRSYCLVYILPNGLLDCSECGG